MIDNEHLTTVVDRARLDPDGPAEPCQLINVKDLVASPTFSALNILDQPDPPLSAIGLLDQTEFSAKSSALEFEAEFFEEETASTKFTGCIESVSHSPGSSGSIPSRRDHLDSSPEPGLCNAALGCACKPNQISLEDQVLLGPGCGADLAAMDPLSLDSLCAGTSERRIDPGNSCHSSSATNSSPNLSLDGGTVSPNLNQIQEMFCGEACAEQQELDVICDREDPGKLSKVKDAFVTLSVMSSPVRAINSRKYARIDERTVEQVQERNMFCSPFRRRREKKTTQVEVPPEEFRRIYLDRLEYEGNYFKYDDSEDEDICTCPACLESYESLYADYLNKYKNLKTVQYCNLM